MLGFPPLVGELMITYAVLCLFTLGQFIKSVHRQRRVLSIHVGFLALSFAWGVDRLLFWSWPRPLHSTCAQDVLTGISAILYSATYGLLVLFLANLLAPLERAATPLFRSGTHPRALASPPAYGSTTFIAGSVPESDVAESPYTTSVLGNVLHHPTSRREGPTFPLEERSWGHPATRKRINTVAYFVLNALLLALFTSMFWYGCTGQAVNLPAMHQTLCASVNVALTVLLVYYCSRLLRYSGTERIQLLAITAIGICAARSLWHLSSLWLPQAYTEDVLTLNGVKVPSLFQFFGTLISELPMWAVLIFFWREGARNVSVPKSSSTNLAISQSQDLVFYPASTSYGATAFKGAEPGDAVKPSVIIATSTTGPIRHNISAHETHWNGSMSTFDSLDAESFLPQSLTGVRSVVMGLT